MYFFVRREIKLTTKNEHNRKNFKKRYRSSNENMGVAKTLSNYLLPLMLNPTMALCEIQLFNAPNSTDHYAQYDSMGAQFGDSIPDEGLFGLVQLADPVNACGHLNNTDIPEPSQEGNRTIYPILLIKRGDCEFHEKVWNFYDFYIL